MFVQKGTDEMDTVLTGIVLLTGRIDSFPSYWRRSGLLDEQSHRGKWEDMQDYRHWNFNEVKVNQVRLDTFSLLFEPLLRETYLSHIFKSINTLMIIILTIAILSVYSFIVHMDTFSLSTILVRISLACLAQWVWYGWQSPARVSQSYTETYRLKIESSSHSNKNNSYTVTKWPYR